MRVYEKKCLLVKIIVIEKENKRFDEELKKKKEENIKKIRGIGLVFIDKKII